ncbi:hypothetical protein [Pseudoblastomonas flavescens]|nr:hypothetical protein [Alteriqipengyuania flavescens]WJY19895.1 hypothetical protein QQW98_06685 [Alteriqipengyuania flavescens]
MSDQRRKEIAEAARDSKKEDQDLRSNPGIGQSKGAYAMGGDLDFAEGENTVEGDVENDPDSQGRVKDTHQGRTNR